MPSIINPADQWVPKNLSIQDTAAYKIIRQITDHTWGSEIDLSDNDIIFIYRNFNERGGSWEGLMDGNMSNVKKLEESIDSLVAPRKMEED